MKEFTVIGFLRERAEWKIQPVVVGGIKFDIMMLTADQASEVTECRTYDSMLTLAAHYGISFNNQRLSSDEEFAKNIDAIWEQESLKVDAGECVKHRVGELICEISGLSDVLLERLEADRQAAIAVDGDNLPGADITMQQLEDDAAAYGAA